MAAAEEAEAVPVGGGGDDGGSEAEVAAAVAAAAAARPWLRPRRPVADTSWKGMSVYNVVVTNLVRQ